MRWLALAAVLLLTSQQPALAVDRFEVADDLSKASIEKSYADVQSMVRRWTKGAGGFIDCEEGEWKGRCYKIDQPKVFAAPYPAVAPSAKTALTTDDFGWFLTKDPELEGTSWVPAKSVKDGTALFTEWSRLAENPQPFGCTDSDCMVFARSFWRKGGDNQKTISLCTVGRKLDGGPPSFCSPIASTVGGALWIRAKVALIPAGGEGKPDFTLTFVLDKKVDAKAIVKSVQQLLSDKPWQFLTELLPAGIRAIGGRRVSPIVATLRESASVRVDVVDAVFHDRKLGNLPFVKLQFSTMLYINDVNTTRPEDWHLPTPEVQQVYVTHLLGSVKTGVVASCPDPHWVDDYNATCGIPDPQRRDLKVRY